MLAGERAVFEPFFFVVPEAGVELDLRALGVGQLVHHQGEGENLFVPRVSVDRRQEPRSLDEQRGMRHVGQA